MLFRGFLIFFSEAWTALLDFYFPEKCAACSGNLGSKEFGICIPCLASLPITDFHIFDHNPVFKQLESRFNISHASSAFYFRKGNRVQALIHEIKYKNAWKAARELGRYYGNILFENEAYRNIDAMIPVPLHTKRMEQRGFNQSEEFCLGLQEVINKPILSNYLIRTKNSPSQTKKDRIHRFDLLSQDFKILHGEELKNQKILLVDDLITTGATLEACSQLIFHYTEIPLKLVSIAYTLI